MRRQRKSAARFHPGRITATPGFLAAATRTETNPMPFLARHLTGDWGDVDAHDRAENEFSVSAGFRILSAYRLPDGEKFWIITESDRSVTTFLLPEEY